MQIRVDPQLYEQLRREVMDRLIALESQALEMGIEGVTVGQEVILSTVVVSRIGLIDGLPILAGYFYPLPPTVRESAEPPG